MKLVPLQDLKRTIVESGQLTESATPLQLPITVMDYIVVNGKVGQALHSYTTPESAKNGILIGFGDKEYSITESKP